MYDESAAAGRQTLPGSAAAAHTARVEPCRRPSTTLGFGPSHAGDGILPNGDFTFVDDLVVNDAHLPFTSGNERQLVDLTTQRSPLKEFLTFDELFAFEDDTSGQHQCLADVSMTLHDNLNQKPASWCAWMRSNVSLAVMTENTSVKPNSSFLTVLQSERPHAQHNANVIIQSLRSFPTMMLRRETFPWFIHPHSQGTALPEAISNCMSIAQMFTLRTSETKSFLRQTIGGEHRRFISEVRFLLTSRSPNTDCQKDVLHV